MAEKVTLARPYAKAVFDLAITHQTETQWARILACLAFAVVDKPMAKLIANPEVSKSQLITFLNEICDVVLAEQNNELNKERHHFICLLAEAHRLHLLPEIEQLYRQMLADKEGLVEIAVTSAFLLNDEQRQAIEKRLAKRFNAKVDLSFNEDEAIIGGLIIRAGNWVMDGSIKSQLAKLGETLTSN